jgi:hypothetical protein
MRLGLALSKGTQVCVVVAVVKAEELGFGAYNAFTGSMYRPRCTHSYGTQMCVVVVVVGDGVVAVVDTKEQCKRLHGYLASLKTRSFVRT